MKRKPCPHWKHENCENPKGPWACPKNANDHCEIVPKKRKKK